MSQELPPVGRWKCPTCPGTQNGTPETTVSAAYGSCTTMSLPSPRPDDGIGRTSIVCWTAGIRDSSHISNKYSDCASEAKLDIFGTALCWRTVSEISQVADLYFFAMTLFPVSWCHGTILYHVLCPIPSTFLS